MFIIMFFYNLLISTALLLLIAKNPRYMMQDYPPEITSGIPPQTAEEKRSAMRYGLPFMLILAGFPLVYGLVTKFSGGMGFADNLLRIFFLMFSFNLVDLLVLDWMIFCWLTPDFLVLPGTKGHPGYKNYRFHFIGFLKGTLIVSAASLVFTALIEGISQLFLMIR